MWMRTFARPRSNALTIPKECLRRDANGVGVFALRGGRLAWQAVRTGVSSVTRVQILEGLAEGGEVALPTELTLHDGESGDAATAVSSSYCLVMQVRAAS
jgi:hypothetical protein